ncbi:hypothetical protein DAEQUDRAFT_654937, partial [Daedalea quercina L-15889]
WYDYALNLDREIRYFWDLKWSLNKVLFFCYRYPVLVNTALTFLTTLTGSWQTHWVCCQSVSRLVPHINHYNRVFAALRVYALFSNSRVLVALVLLSSLLNPAIFIYIFTRSIPTGITDLQGCTLSISVVGLLESTGTMLARAASVLSDGIVLVLTLVKT